MKRSTTQALAASLMLVLAGSACAGRDHPRGGFEAYHDEARVISSTPVYEEVNTPRQECWNERVEYRYEAPRERTHGGAILGTIVGGIIGHQIGKGTGRAVATAVGAATGALVGDNLDNRNAQAATVFAGPREIERCRLIDNWNQRVVGYDVVYRYHGRDYSAFMPYDPGRNVRLSVSIQLVDR